MKPQTVIFSSSSAFHIAQGLHAALSEKFAIHLWRGDFFGENKTTPLWTFFKKLFHYDYAILILSDDNIILDGVFDEQKHWVPKDNVIFELGATMARLGPQKTILVVPDKPSIHLPGYFDDVMPHKFIYTKPATTDLKDAKLSTAKAAREITLLLEEVNFTSFHSELPGQGLAHAYIANFLSPAMRMDIEQSFTIDGKTMKWRKECGVMLTIIIPESIMEREAVNDFFKDLPTCFNINIKTSGGRNLSVYVLPRKDENAPLHILDIPTTLFTAGEIVENIEAFWRAKDAGKILERDADFSEALKKREILNFSRPLQKKLSDSPLTYIVDITDLSAHISQHNFNTG